MSSLAFLLVDCASKHEVLNTKQIFLERYNLEIDKDPLLRFKRQTFK